MEKRRRVSFFDDDEPSKDSSKALLCIEKAAEKCTQNTRLTLNDDDDSTESDIDEVCETYKDNDTPTPTNADEESIELEPMSKMNSRKTSFSKLFFVPQSTRAFSIYRFRNNSNSSKWLPQNNASSDTSTNRGVAQNNALLEKKKSICIKMKMLVFGIILTAVIIGVTLRPGGPVFRADKMVTQPNEMFYPSISPAPSMSLVPSLSSISRTPTSSSQ